MGNDCVQHFTWFVDYWRGSSFFDWRNSEWWISDGTLSSPTVKYHVCLHMCSARMETCISARIIHEDSVPSWTVAWNMGVNLELTHLTHIQVRWCTTPDQRPAALLNALSNVQRLCDCGRLTYFSFMRSVFKRPEQEDVSRISDVHTSMFRNMLTGKRTKLRSSLN